MITKTQMKKAIKEAQAKFFNDLDTAIKLAHNSHPEYSIMINEIELELMTAEILK